MLRSLRVIIAALVAGSMLTLPAYAQRGGGGGKRHQGASNSTETKKPKVDEKAYKGALDSIPERKADPWAKIR